MSCVSSIKPLGTSWISTLWEPLGKSKVMTAPTCGMDHVYPIADLAVCPKDEGIIVTVSEKIRVWSHGILQSQLDPRETDSEVCCPFTSVAFASDSSVFGVTDIDGNCSLWDAKSLKNIETYNLSDRILYGVVFIKSSPLVFACVDETGSVFVVDRSTEQVTCAEGPSIMPACQPTMITWLGTQFCVAFQTSGSVFIYELNSILQAASKGPTLIARVGGSSSISGISMLEPNLFVLTRDSGEVEIWKLASNKAQQVWTFKIDIGVSSLTLVNQEIFVGTPAGRVVSVDWNKALLVGQAVKEFGPTAKNKYPALPL